MILNTRNVQLPEAADGLYDTDLISMSLPTVEEPQRVAPLADALLPESEPRKRTWRDSVADFISPSDEEREANRSGRRWQHAMQHHFLWPDSDYTQMVQRNAQIEVPQNRVDANAERWGSMALTKQKQDILARKKDLNANVRNGSLSPQNYEKAMDDLEAKWVEITGTPLERLDDYSTDTSKRTVRKAINEADDIAQQYNMIGDPEITDGQVSLAQNAIMKSLANDKGMISDADAIRYLMNNLPEETKDLYIQNMKSFINQMAELSRRATTPVAKRDIEATLNALKGYAATKDWDKLAVTAGSSLAKLSALDYGANWSAGMAGLESSLRQAQNTALLNPKVNRTALQRILRYQYNNKRKQAEDLAADLRVEVRPGEWDELKHWTGDDADPTGDIQRLPWHLGPRIEGPPVEMDEVTDDDGFIWERKKGSNDQWKRTTRKAQS